MAVVFLSSMRRARALLIGALVAGTRGDGRWAEGGGRYEIRTTPRTASLSSSNPRQLRALQLLDRQKPGVARRIRFEWDAVPGARRYVLTGHWTSPPSWAVQSQQHRVDRQNATVWETRRVALEVPLVEGFHSWSVVALLGPDEHGDFEHPTTASFDVR